MLNDSILLRHIAQVPDDIVALAVYYYYYHYNNYFAKLFTHVYIIINNINAVETDWPSFMKSGKVTQS